jgi:hypothetical protein
MSKAQEIFDTTFVHGWTYPHPRSPEFQAGYLYVLRRELEGAKLQDCPYACPSAQADAFIYGCLLALEYIREHKGAAA